MLVPTFRAYLGQRDEYAALAARVEHQERTVADLKHELEQWKDPAFIEAQARARLTFVYPGETAYQVIDLDRITPAVRQPPPGTPRPGTELTPYYATLLDSLRSIDQGPTPPPAGPGNADVPLAPALLPKPSGSPSPSSSGSSATRSPSPSPSPSQSSPSRSPGRSSTPSGSGTSSATP